MLFPFFTLAAQSPGWQRSFRRALIAHLTLLAGVAWLAMGRHGPPALPWHLLLVAGIVEGAALVGWRLTQLPKSQALEFLLVSPMRPAGVLCAEALVGLGRLACVTLAGLPVLVLLVIEGHLEAVDLGPLLVMPFTWGAIAGLGLTAWAYEPLRVRRWVERGTLALIVLYLGIGLLVGERIKDWIVQLSADQARWLLIGFVAFHRYNPFGVLEHWMREDPDVAQERMLGLEVVALGVVLLLLARAACRLKGHFHDRHYRPIVDLSAGRRGRIGDWPLSWWAVRRVREYSGRINLWLAAGFGIAYALYLLAGPFWPAWLGRRVFDYFEQVGGVAGLTTALVVLAAVPAAFQYGLWDSNAQDRCRRLELLLLTGLEARDYWQAATSAAWRRGRGYFAVAVLLWSAAAVAGKLAIAPALVALAAGVALWALYFALGFRAFARGMQANGLGMVLTLGLPLLAYGCHWAGWSSLAGLVPPGSVYGPAAGSTLAQWLLGPGIAGIIALVLARWGLARCDGDLRRWYDRHSGRRVLD